MSGTLITLTGLAILTLLILIKNATVVPQQNAYIVENLGKYRKTLRAGFHFLIPFFDRLSARHSMKEQSIDTEAQTCITKDNVQVQVDGILYLRVEDPKMATYGIENYRLALVRLVQTTLRSEIGKMDLDQTLESRELINARLVEAVDRPSQEWGVKVLRYEIKEVVPPEGIIKAMARQVEAERLKRAAVLRSEGERDAQINAAEGQKQEVIKAAEASRQDQILRAEGEATAIRSVAEATAHGLREVAGAMSADGGDRAMELRVAEQYLAEFGKLAQEGNTLVIPANLGDIAGMVAAATKVARNVKTA